MIRSWKRRFESYIWFWGTEMAEYTRCKTVRFTDETWKKIEIAASMFGITTSQYIRTLVRNTVAKIDPAQVLPPEGEAS